jgi:hypothetical protein
MQVTLRQFIVDSLPRLPLEVISKQLGKQALYDGDYTDEDTIVEVDKTGQPVWISQHGVKTQLQKVDVAKEVDVVRQDMAREYTEVQTPEEVLPPEAPKET